MFKELSKEFGENMYMRKHKDDITFLPNDVWSVEEITALVNGKYKQHEN